MRTIACWRSMRYSSDALRDLAAKATPLSQRWQGVVVPDTPDHQQVASRLRQWQEALASDGNADLLARRLAFDGLDLEFCRRSLGDVRLADDQPLPAWAERFNTLLQRC